MNTIFSYLLIGWSVVGVIFLFCILDFLGSLETFMVQIKSPSKKLLFFATLVLCVGPVSLMLIMGVALIGLLGFYVIMPICECIKKYITKLITKCANWLIS